MTADATLHTRLLAEIDGYITDAASERYPVARPLAAVRAVVELHAPHDRQMGGPLICSECNGTHGEDYPWPCSTIQAIADQLGLTEGTDHRD